MGRAESESPEDYADTPEGWSKRWEKEMEAADQFLKRFRDQGDKCLKKYTDERGAQAGSPRHGETHLNIYWRNTQVMRALLYGKTPSVEVTRKFGDPTDGVARLASEIQERALNCDIERDGEDGYSTVMGEALDDRLHVGLGQARVRYVVEQEEQPGRDAILGEDGEELAPAVPSVPKKRSEDVEVLFIHWRDFAYSPCRIWGENRWVGFRNEMTRKGLNERFLASLMELTGKDEASCRLLIETIPLSAKKANAQGDTPMSSDEVDGRARDPWQRAEVWEIWDKESRRVFWWVRGFEVVLDMKPDPLELRSFFPCPRPMMANVTNSSLLAKADYMMLEDLYGEIDSVSRRITLLQRVIRAAGVYDETAGDIAIARLVNEGGNNEMVPIKNWGRWVEKGGAKGQIDWLPLDIIVNALAQLRDYRTELMSQADQISGMSDIMRGEASAQAATATEQGIKAKFASVRMGALQDEFARFCSDIQRLKGEVMSKHFDARTYIEKSNLMNSFDGQNPQEVLAAIQLLKSQYADYRIEVKPDQVAMQDFAQLKAERSEVIQGIAQFISSAAPLAQMLPGSAGFLGELLKWFISGLRGARSIEGELDKAIAQLEAAQKQAALMPRPPAPPDPKLQAAQLKLVGDQQKAQQDMAKEQFKLQSNLATIQAETVAKDKEEQSQAFWNTQEARAKHLIQGPKVTPTEPGPGLGYAP